VCVCVCAQSQPTPCHRMDCSSTRLFCSWDSPAKNTGVRLPFPTPGDVPNPRIKPMSLVSPALTGGFFTTVPPGKPVTNVPNYYKGNNWPKMESLVASLTSVKKDLIPTLIAAATFPRNVVSTNQSGIF